MHASELSNEERDCGIIRKRVRAYLDPIKGQSALPARVNMYGSVCKPRLIPYHLTPT